MCVGKRSPLPKRMTGHFSGGNIGSPFQGVPPTDIDNMSPTKSPSQQQQQLQQQSLGQMLAFGKPSSNFNPNAPSFVPMGMPQVLGVILVIDYNYHVHTCITVHINQ